MVGIIYLVFVIIWTLNLLFCIVFGHIWACLPSILHGIGQIWTYLPSILWDLLYVGIFTLHFAGDLLHVGVFTFHFIWDLLHIGMFTFHFAWGFLHINIFIILLCQPQGIWYILAWPPSLHHYVIRQAVKRRFNHKNACYGRWLWLEFPPLYFPYFYTNSQGIWYILAWSPSLHHYVTPKLSREG